jgi:hypothetical protein
MHSEAVASPAATTEKRMTQTFFMYQDSTQKTRVNGADSTPIPGKVKGHAMRAPSTFPLNF